MKRWVIDKSFVGESSQIHVGINTENNTTNLNFLIEALILYKNSIQNEIHVKPGSNFQRASTLY